MIIGNPTSGGDSTSEWKAYAQATIAKHLRQRNNPEITFEVGEDEYLDHDDALVISVRIAST